MFNEKITNILTVVDSAVSAQIWASPNLNNGPPNGDNKKTFTTLCYISRPNGLQNKIF